MLPFEQLEGQSAHSEDLIRTERAVHLAHSMVCVNHVVEAPAFLVPKFITEGFQTEVESFLPLRSKLTGDQKCVKPERLNFHRLARAWRDNPFANLRVHPGELHAAL